MLGYFVEVVSGMPLDKFLDERLFKPLGMKDTGFFLPQEKVSRLASAYTYYPEKGLQPFRDQQTIEEGASSTPQTTHTTDQELIFQEAEDFVPPLRITTASAR